MNKYILILVIFLSACNTKQVKQPEPIEPVAPPVIQLEKPKADKPSAETIKEVQNKCSYEAKIYSTTQQVRQEYMVTNGHELSWNEFLTTVVSLNFKKDEGLKKNLKMSQLVFTYIPLEMPLDKVAGIGFDNCLKIFNDQYKGEAI